MKVLTKVCPLLVFRHIRTVLFQAVITHRRVVVRTQPAAVQFGEALSAIGMAAQRERLVREVVATVPTVEALAHRESSLVRVVLSFGDSTAALLRLAGLTRLDQTANMSADKSVSSAIANATGHAGFVKLIAVLLLLATLAFAVIALSPSQVVPTITGDGLGSKRVRVAVAANFVTPLNALIPRFEQIHPYDVDVIVGSTGMLYAQISQGAPFDVFLAADQARPRALEEAGLALPGSRFTYAEGQLVLWQPTGLPASSATGSAASRLRAGDVRSLALANPRLAPYGHAAQAWLVEQGLNVALENRLVFGESVAQAAAMTATGNAELGLVSYALVLGQANPGAFWLLPRQEYPRLRQDAVQLVRAAENPAANAFLEFLRSPQIQLRIAELGYAEAATK